LSFAVRCDDSVAQFLITIDPMAKQAFLKPSVASLGYAGAGDQFGRSAAVSGDTVIVGANGEHSTPNELPERPMCLCAAGACGASRWTSSLGVMQAGARQL
jgi:FG-GAP repeat